jgi:hypothetical protein
MQVRRAAHPPAPRDTPQPISTYKYPSRKYLRNKRVCGDAEATVLGSIVIWS